MIILLRVSAESKMILSLKEKKCFTDLMACKVATFSAKTQHWPFTEDMKLLHRVATAIMKIQNNFKEEISIWTKAV